MLVTGVDGVLSGSSMLSNVAIARKELEGELEEHLKAIVMVKRRLNALTTISLLPGEILSEIFLCIAQDYFRSYVNNMQRSSYYNHPYCNPDWIRVDHVCHAWRETALTTPHLWGSIPVIRRSMADQLLARSKKAPLSVAIDNFEHDDERMAVLDTIFSGQTSRLTELFVNSRYWIVYELCDKITEPANLLHTLALSDRSSRHSTDDPEHIPHNLFDGHTPRLRSLDIRGLHILWENPLLCPTLTSLIITACCNPKTMGTFEHLLSALEPMSSLHTLELTNAIPPARKALDPSSPSRVITFPNLSNLRLNGDAHCSAHFLDHISLAPNVLPQLTCSWSKSCFFDLILAVKAHIARSNPLHVVQLRQEHRPGQRLRLYAWHTRVAFANTSVITEPASFVFEITDFQWVSVYQDLFQLSAAFTKLQTLVIETPEDRERAWAAIFAGTPNLCELIVQHTGSKSMLAALSSTSTLRVPGYLEDNHTPSPLLPLLKVFKFNDVRLDGPIFGMKEEYFHQLVECTTFRRNSNCPIQEIYITRCRNIVEEDVECLRKIVPVVVWDEVVDVEHVPDVRDEEDEEEDEEDDEDEDEDSDEDEDEDEDSDEDEGDNKSDESEEDEDEEDGEDGDDSMDSNDELEDDHPFGGNMNSYPDDSDDDGA